jgi:hypothetical protein
MSQRSVPIQIYNNTVNVANGGSLLHASPCKAERFVTVQVKNPVGSGQTLTVQFLISMDNVEFVDIAEQGLIDIPASEKRIKVFNVEGINFYEIIAVPSGAGINSVPLRVDHQV